jgi:hypothetical protein
VTCAAQQTVIFGFTMLAVLEVKPNSRGQLRVEPPADIVGQQGLHVPASQGGGKRKRPARKLVHRDYRDEHKD